MGTAKNRESDSAPFEKHPHMKRMGLNCIARRTMSVEPVRASVWWIFCLLFHRVRGEMSELLDLRLSSNLPVLSQDLQADDPLNLLASLCLRDPP